LVRVICFPELLELDVSDRVAIGNIESYLNYTGVSGDFIVSWGCLFPESSELEWNKSGMDKRKRLTTK
jgi:hypothetical protein